MVFLTLEARPLRIRSAAAEREERDVSRFKDTNMNHPQG